MIRKYLGRGAIGFVLGVLFGMVYGPRLITWWWVPPGPRTAFACDHQIEAATSALIEFQVIAGTLGAVAVLTTAFIYTRHKAKKAVADRS